MKRYGIYANTDLDIIEESDGSWVRWENVPRWISVDERLPKTWGKCLTWSASWGVDTLTYWPSQREFGGMGAKYPPTHWMPLPPEPHDRPSDDGEASE